MMLNVNNVSFAYDQKKVLEEVSFQLPQGKHLAIMGESGSGKSTLLKLIYGLIEPNKGEISWQGKKVMGPRFQLIPGEAKMKLVSQEPDLMPFISVKENIATHLSVFDRENHENRLKTLMQLVGLTNFSNRRADRLSGGQKQRVALAKAIALEPELLLLDEPFSNIDQFLKNHLRLQFFANLKEKGITLVTASHDAEDVIPFADYLLVVKNGKAIAFGSPKELFDQPKNFYVASLFGYVNELPLSLFTKEANYIDTVLIYPHEFEVNNYGVEVRVVNSYFKGFHFLIEGVTEGGNLICFLHKSALKPHTKVHLGVSDELLKNRGLEH